MEDHVGPRPLQLRDQRGQVGSARRIALVENDLEAVFLGALDIALRDIGAVGAVFVNDRDAQILRLLPELRLRVFVDHLGRGQTPLPSVRLRPEDILQVAALQHRRGDAGRDPHEFLELLDPRRGRHALGRRIKAEQHVDLFLLDQAHGFVYRNVGLALRIGVDRLDLVPGDAAMRVEPVDHDLGAEILQLRPAPGERPGQVIDDADLDRLLRLLRPPDRRRQTAPPPEPPRRPDAQCRAPSLSSP